MRNVLESLWAEPRAPRPPTRGGRDWILVLALLTAFALELALRVDMKWRAVGVVMVAVLVAALLFRRAEPFAALAVTFGVTIAVDLATVVAGVGEPVSPYSMAFLLVLVYALFRWGSGREAVVGAGLGFVAAGVGLARDQAGWPDVVIGLVILSLPAVLGASVRFWTTSRSRELDQMRLREREQLARELHDTVAHHVSAMVIRAQAGRVVAASSPAAALEALAIIEREGSRTLAEMRSMVSALRDGDDPDLAPQLGVADLESLARPVGDGPTVELDLTGELDGLRPSVDAALYRIVQESITNARRHAQHATRIDVSVVGGQDVVRLTVTDDGDPTTTARTVDGYGIVGMTERATILGGTFRAGPGTGHGWVVDVVLPRDGSAA